MESYIKRNLPQMASESHEQNTDPQTSHFSAAVWSISHTCKESSIWSHSFQHDNRIILHENP